MENIYSFLRNVLLKGKNLQQGDKTSIILISAVLITIPLNYFYNSLAIGIFVGWSLISAIKSRKCFNLSLLLPLLLFLLMVLSVFWTEDVKLTLKSLGKEASLVLIPVCFGLNSRIYSNSVKKIIKNYSAAMVLLGVYFIARAFMRYFNTKDFGVFFYHELSTQELNAIYLSIFLSVALFYYLSIQKKSNLQYGCIGFLFLLIFLLSSKTIIIIDTLLVVMYYLLFSEFSKKARFIAVLVFLTIMMVLGFNSKIKERIAEEFNTNTQEQLTYNEAIKKGTVYNVTIKDAWELETFGENAYFNGTAFRVYQFRIFIEMLKEDPIFFCGYGFNASKEKIREKAEQHVMYRGDGVIKGYGNQNFHNQYIQVFAELGVFGFVLIILMLFTTLKKGIKNKDFINIAFAILIITLFLTESFIWRQRGLVLFIMFYCLFNTCILPTATEKEKYEKNTNNRSSGFFRLSLM